MSGKKISVSDISWMKGDMLSWLLNTEHGCNIAFEDVKSLSGLEIETLRMLRENADFQKAIKEAHQAIREISSAQRKVCILAEQLKNIACDIIRQNQEKTNETS